MPADATTLANRRWNLRALINLVLEVVSIPAGVSLDKPLHFIDHPGQKKRIQLIRILHEGTSIIGLMLSPDHNMYISNTPFITKASLV